METGHSAAGDGNKQNWEHALALYHKAGKGRQIYRGLCHKHAHNSCQNHGHQQIAVQVITRLEQCPNGSNRSNEHINEHNDMPGALGDVHGEV